MDGVTELMPAVGLVATCSVMRVNRAGVYRRWRLHAASAAGASGAQGAHTLALSVPE
ncbi:MAG: hypothetical protein V4457_00630 [Pseudomonadota bacterium]